MWVCSCATGAGAGTATMSKGQLFLLYMGVIRPREAQSQEGHGVGDKNSMDETDRLS